MRALYSYRAIPLFLFLTGALTGALIGFSAFPALAETDTHKSGPFRAYLEKRLQAEVNKRTGQSSGLYEKGENYQGRSENAEFNGRKAVVYVPDHLPPVGQRSLVVVLHGGMGSAIQIQSYLGLDPLADRYGFIVAYLNGTQVMAAGAETMRGWNAGECCGQPQRKKTDDVAYISKTVDELISRYGIHPQRIFGTGHSNGAMMTQRLMCETNIYQATVPFSGPLELDVDSCPPARGKRILAIHGADDKNAPPDGGYGSEAINKRTNYRSQAYSKEVFEASGADYQLIILDGASHNPESLNEALIKTNGVTLPETIIKFFGLDRK